MDPSEITLTREKILEENKRVHKLEDKSYLDRHPEQTNFFQIRILNKTVDQVCSLIETTKGDVLELGCGTGYLYMEFLKRGYKITGVDLSTEMINVLKSRIPKNFEKHSKLVVSDIESFAEVDDKKYSAIIVSALLHHLYDYESVIKMYCERLIPGGVFLIFFEPLKQNINSSTRYTMHKILARIDETLYRQQMMRKKISVLDGEYHHADYQRQFGGIDPHRIADVFTKEGLKIRKIDKYCARRFGLSSLLATCLFKTQNTFNLLAEK
jgi:SAM-dependent methyltransferase